MYIYPVYDRIFGDLPARNAVYTAYIYLVLANFKYPAFIHRLLIGYADRGGQCAEPLTIAVFLIILLSTVSVQMQVADDQLAVLIRGECAIPHITLSFINNSLSTVSLRPQVADNQLAVLIRGECAVPRITLSTPVLEFGECFVRHPYK